MLFNLMRGFGIGPQSGQGQSFNPLERVATGVNNFASGLSGMMQGGNMDFRPTDTGMMETGNNPWNLGMRQPGQAVGDFLMQQLTASPSMPNIPARTGQDRGDPDYANVDLNSAQALQRAMMNQSQRNLQQQQQMQNRNQQVKQGAADFSRQFKRLTR